MGAEDITITLAVLAGLLSFVSPCVLPLMPVYLSYLTGITVSSQNTASSYQIFGHALLFVSGFSVVFVLIGASMGLVFGTFIRTDLADWLMKVGGVLLIVLGLHMSRIAKWAGPRLAAVPSVQRPLVFLDRKLDEFILPERRLQIGHGRAPGLVRSGVVGMSFAAGWTPCIGPLLGGILTLAAGSAYQVDAGNAVIKSAGLLFAYSAGLAIPFLITAIILGRATGLLQAINRHGRTIELVSAVFLLGIGVLLFSGSIATLNQYFSATPQWLYELETGLLRGK